MNLAHVHLLLNHLPVLGTLFGLALLTLGLLRKSKELQAVSLATFVFCALMAIPTFLTGEPAEGYIENAPGVGEAWIESHEAAAKVSLVLIELLGAASLVAWVLIRRASKAVTMSLLAIWCLAAVALISLGYTAKLGGEIRHAEIRSGNPSSAAVVAEGEEQSQRNAEHEDRD